MRAAPRFALITSVVLILLPEPGPALIDGHQTRRGTERQSVRYLLRSFVSAWNRNNAEAVAQLFLNDGKFISTLRDPKLHHAPKSSRRSEGNTTRHSQERL